MSDLKEFVGNTAKVTLADGKVYRLKTPDMNVFAECEEYTGRELMTARGTRAFLQAMLIDAYEESEIPEERVFASRCQDIKFVGRLMPMTSLSDWAEPLWDLVVSALKNFLPPKAEETTMTDTPTGPESPSDTTAPSGGPSETSSLSPLPSSQTLAPN